MRALWLVLGLFLLGGGAWWVLRPATAPDPTLDPAGPLREPAARTGPEPPALEAPRVGVRGPQDRGIVANPQAEPWESYVLTLEGAPDDAVTGGVLLDAIGERLYVRARSQAELDALRAQVFEGMRRDGPITLGSAKAAIEQAGWRVAVSDPRFVFRPGNADELERVREAAGDGR